MKRKLSHIASLHSGVFSKPSLEGDIIYLQGNHFDTNGILMENIKPDISSSDINVKHLLKENDIVFLAKGKRNFAYHFKQMEIPIAVSTTFLVIRLISIFQIEPEYLTWYLNTPECQTKIKNIAKGTAILSISIKMLEELEIPIPTLEKQRKILEIVRLNNKLNKIQQNLIDLRNIKIQNEINKQLY